MQQTTWLLCSLVFINKVESYMATDIACLFHNRFFCLFPEIYAVMVPFSSKRQFLGYFKFWGHLLKQEKMHFKLGLCHLWSERHDDMVKYSQNQSFTSPPQGPRYPVPPLVWTVYYATQGLIAIPCCFSTLWVYVLSTRKWVNLVFNNGNVKHDNALS